MATNAAIPIGAIDDRARVITTATQAAADRLGLDGQALASALGVSPATVSRWRRGHALIDPDTKVGEFALMLIRVFRGVDALLGGEEEALRTWFHGDNLHLGGPPAELIQRAEGMVHVLDYVDAMRGR